MRLGHLKAHQRVLLLTVVAVSAGLVMLATTLVSMSGPEQASHNLARKDVPADRALDDVIVKTAESQILFLEAVAATDPVQRAAVISRAERLGAQAERAWNRYTRLGPFPPAERRLQKQFDTSYRDGRAAGASVFSANPLSDPFGYDAALNREKQLSADEQLILGKIRNEHIRPTITSNAAETSTGIDDTRRNVLIAFGVVLLVGLGVAAGMFGSARRDERTWARERVEREREARRSELETQLQRGLEMEPTEEATFDVVEAALRYAAPGIPAELLVADSSRSHFRQVLSTEEGLPACPVGSPRDCPAASSGQQRLFLDSTRIDACPYLRNRGGDPLWAVCVPLSIAGQANGVIHVAAPIGATLPVEAVQELELIGRKAGDRMGVLRVLARTETQAQIDALTGLPNRRTVEHEGHELIAHENAFCVAFADLDHFKVLNDTHGHEMGDRALRLFARVLRDSVRPNDLPARFGGEEFVVVLPECSLGDARTVAERLRTRLERSFAGATVPPFTVSVGLASREPGETFSEVVARADAALMTAKGTGRDRVVSTSDLPSSTDGLGEASTA